MKKFMFITLLLILFSRSINADVDFITDAMLESAVTINESEVIFNDNGDTIGIKINGDVGFEGYFRLYKSPYDETIVFDSVENSEVVISIQILPKMKKNRLISNQKFDCEKVVQMIFRIGERIFIYENVINNDLEKIIEHINVYELPEEKIQLLDWWLMYIKPTTSIFDLGADINNYTQSLRSGYNNRVERKRVLVRYDKFDTEYEMDVIADLRTYNIGYYGDGEQRISLGVQEQRQYENGRYRDNIRALLVRDPIFRYELVDHSGIRNEDGFTEVKWECPIYIVRRPKFKFGNFSTKPWDWIEIDRSTVGGFDSDLLNYGTKKFGSQVIGATDGDWIHVSAILKKNSRGNYRHKLYVDIEFDFCYYNYHTVVGSERMYVAGYIDSND